MGNSLSTATGADEASGQQQGSSHRSIGDLPAYPRRRPTSIRPTPAVHGRQVELHVYDLDKVVSHLNAVTRAFSWGAFHVGVEVYGEEWSFGQTTDPQATGLCMIRPKSHEVHVYRESVPMGNTHLTRDSVWRLMVTMRKEWLGGGYHILRRNCIHFAKALCLRLGCDKEFPSWIEALPSRTEGLSQTFDVASAHVRALDDWLRISQGFNSLRSSVTVTILRQGFYQAFMDRPRWAPDALWRIQRATEIIATAAVPVFGASATSLAITSDAPIRLGDARTGEREAMLARRPIQLPPAVLTAARQRGAPLQPKIPRPRESWTRSSLARTAEDNSSSSKLPSSRTVVVVPPKETRDGRTSAGFL